MPVIHLQPEAQLLVDYWLRKNVRQLKMDGTIVDSGTEERDYSRCFNEISSSGKRKTLPMVP
ncbi:MAG: hypothetical protein IPP46_07700 [Bacteroidetes bacterium]|nr:hypothetical protein [Bacteroidota bacterium]